MLTYPKIDPVIFHIGPLALRWYGLMYVLGFLSSYLLVIYQIAKKKLPVDRTKIDDLYFALIMGLIIGARLGYVFFYNLGFYLENPLEIFILWHGGMSFHGGLIGSFIAGYIVMKRKGLNIFATLDLIIPTCPVGIGFGRLGNFINGELFGKPSDVPWAMVFPYGGNIARHPSQLYEAFLEGLILFLLLWFYKGYKKRDGDVFALFLMFYGVFRVFCEFFREPEGKTDVIFGPMTMGMLLSGMMVIIGIVCKYFYLPAKSQRRNK